MRETFALEREMLSHRRYPLAELQRMAGGRSLFEVVFNFVHFHVYQNLGGLQEIDFSAGSSLRRQTSRSSFNSRWTCRRRE